MTASTLVIIPTFNEAETLSQIVGRVQATGLPVDVLIVDDESPDGTGEIADQLSRQQPSTVHVLHRERDGGLCGAYVAGFRWALEHDEYKVICQMDSDGSHDPRELHRLLEAIDAGADAVIGSRYTSGGSCKNWPAFRYMLSKLGNLYIGVALGAGIADMTAGYRAYTRDVLQSIDFDSLSHKGYIFQVEMAWRIEKAGWDIVEVPVTFTDREEGESKLDSSFITESLAQVTSWAFDHRSEQVSELYFELSRLGKAGYEGITHELAGKVGKVRKDAAELGHEVGRLAKAKTHRVYEDSEQRIGKRRQEIKELEKEVARLAARSGANTAAEFKKKVSTVAKQVEDFATEVARLVKGPTNK